MSAALFYITLFLHFINKKNKKKTAAMPTDLLQVEELCDSLPVLQFPYAAIVSEA